MSAPGRAGPAKPSVTEQIHNPGTLFTEGQAGRARRNHRSPPADASYRALRAPGLRSVWNGAASVSVSVRGV